MDRWNPKLARLIYLDFLEIFSNRLMFKLVVGLKQIHARQIDRFLHLKRKYLSKVPLFFPPLNASHGGLVPIRSASNYNITTYSLIPSWVQSEMSETIEMFLFLHRSNIAPRVFRALICKLIFS